MLHLQAGVHLQEVEIAVGVHQELDGAGIVIAGAARHADGGLAHCLAHARPRGDQGRRALFHHFLMAPLDGTLALAEVDHVPVAVAH